MFSKDSKPLVSCDMLSFASKKLVVTFKAAVNDLKNLRFSQVLSLTNWNEKIFGFYRAGRPHPALKRKLSTECCPKMMGLPLKPMAENGQPRYGAMVSRSEGERRHNI